MTRFARAKGSKASNERIPERATPWSAMKEEMKRKQQENEENKEREKLNVVRQQNYDNFLKQQTSEVKTEWAEFPEGTKTKENKIKKNIEKPKKNKKSNEFKDKMIPKEQIMEMLRPDAEIDARLEKLVSQIDVVLNKSALKKKKVETNIVIDKTEDIKTSINKKNKMKSLKKINDDSMHCIAEKSNSEIKKSKNKKKQVNSPKNDSVTENNNSVIGNLGDDDAPVEVSAKIAPAEIVVSKKKNKKKQAKPIKIVAIKQNDSVENIDGDTPVEVSTKIAPAEIVVKKKKNKKKAKPIKIVAIKQNDSVVENLDGDAPVEVSTKIAPAEIVVKKKKNKKKALKIKPVSEMTDENKVETSPKPVNTHVDEKDMTKSMKKRFKRNQKKNELKSKQATEENADKKEENTEKKVAPKNKFNRKQNEPGPNKRKLPNNESEYETPSKFPRKEQKLKVAKVRDDQEHKRRKPDEGVQKMIFDGQEVDVVRFEGFPVKKEDADRLIDLKKKMISKGIPRSEVKRTLILERRKAEKSLSREKKKVCFQCRKAGHMLSECPEIDSQNISLSGSGICYKCGSTEHTHFECRVTRGDDYKFASCFICREQGHIAKQCPDNPKGLYPQGGACKLCGDVTHLKKDCPQTMQEKDENTLFLKTITGENIESIDDDLNKSQTVSTMPAKNKVVKF